MSMYHCTNCPHSYDDSLPKCPYCDAVNPNYNGADNISPTNGANIIPPTDPFNPPVKGDDGKTDIYRPRKDMAVTPVVGWLVCTEGPDKGKDFRLHVDNNFVGRGFKGVVYDVNLKDTKVSRERHFSVAYDRECDSYFVTQGSGTGIVRVNNSPLGSGITYLNKGDKIRVGDTTLVFIPLETAYVQWEWE